MKKSVILLNTNNRDRNAGPKAQLDVVNFLTKNNFEKFIVKVNREKSLSKIFTSYFVFPKIGNEMSEMSEIVIQYPMSRFLMNHLIKSLRAKTNAKIYCVIHDIESLRLKRNDKNFKEDEISLLNKLDGLIVHNTNMLKWLRKNGLKINASPLYLFDYDNPQLLNKKITFGNSICFAGNLAKSTFLKNFHPNNVKLFLYGVGYSSNIQDNNIHYKGSFSPNELPKHLTQNFGLVWDGDSIDTCNGIYGQYLKYNAPHKASLYLSCGIPVIVWKKSGIANYIVKHNLGIAIDSLTQLDSLLDKISFDEYKKMKECCFDEARKIRNGEFITRAIDELEMKE